MDAYIKASNPDNVDNFSGFHGTMSPAVDISGDLLVVGAPHEDSNATGVNGNQTNNSLSNSGAAYVFIRDAGGTWTQEAYLKASNPGSEDDFGTTVAISGSTIVVGAPYEDSNATGVNGDQTDNSDSNAGAAYVFVRDGAGNWTQQAYLKAAVSSTAFGDQGFAGTLDISGELNDKDRGEP